MEGLILSYKRGRKTQTTNQLIISVQGYDKKKAQDLIGKEVIFICEGKNKKQIKGEIKDVHGNKGVLRVLFERGIPGQAIGKKVNIN